MFQRFCIIAQLLLIPFCQFFLPSYLVGLIIQHDKSVRFFKIGIDNSLYQYQFPVFFLRIQLSGIYSQYKWLLSPKSLFGKPMPTLDRLTATGALATYISDHTVAKFQPMNVNFGIIEPLGYKIKGKREKNTKISERALEQIEKLKGEL